MIPVGKVMPRPMGAYDATAVYDILDLVSYNNSLWICKVANTVGVEPTSGATENWQLAINSDVTDAVTLEGHGVSYFATANSVTNVVDGITPVAKAAEADAVPWTGVSDVPTEFAPSAHTHTKSEISDFPTTMVPSAHNQAASTITAGTFSGQVVANASAVANTGTKQLRNIYAGTSEMVAGVTALTAGDIYVQLKV